MGHDDMRILATLVAIGSVLVVAVPSLACAQQTDAERSHLARYQQYVEAPVEQVHYFRVDGFEYLAPDKLAIWFGVNKMYLLTVQTPCLNLSLTHAIALSSDETLYANFDSVKFRHQDCKILKIQPVNELKMKQDAARAPATGG